MAGPPSYRSSTWTSTSGHCSSKAPRLWGAARTWMVGGRQVDELGAPKPPAKAEGDESAVPQPEQYCRPVAEPVAPAIAAEAKTPSFAGHRALAARTREST